MHGGYAARVQFRAADGDQGAVEGQAQCQGQGGRRRENGGEGMGRDRGLREGVTDGDEAQQGQEQFYHLGREPRKGFLEEVTF